MRRAIHSLLWLALGAGFTACTDVGIIPLNFTAEAEGLYCTESSNTYDLPIRILLVIDTSRSMEINDPAGNRGEAAADLVSAYSGFDNVSFGLIAFNTGATRLTESFTSEPAELATALNQINAMEGFTNYLDALSAAEAMINDDIAKVASELQAMEEAGDNTRFARPWYFVVFLSDGIPRMPGGVLQDRAQIIWRDEQLVDVPKEAAGLTLHTAFLGADEDDQRPAAESLLQEMADVGGGTYTSFENGDEIDFTVFSFEIKRMYDVKQVLFHNRNAVLGDLTMMADSDGDGISDLEEKELHTSPVARDTDGDGCSDGFERRAGLDPTSAAYCPCAPNDESDSDNDGLLDCEELFLGYNPDMFDTDEDLFPDGLEHRMGANGADSADWKEDYDFDGVLTGEEIRQGTNPIRADLGMHAQYAYRFAMSRSTPLGSNETCYSIRIENVSMVNTMETSEHGAGINEMVIELIESPEDSAESVFTLRRLVARLKYSRLHPPELVIEPENFETVSRQESENVH